MDIKYIEKKAILHVIDSPTKFGAAEFLPDSSINSILSAFLESWRSVYTGLPIGDVWTESLVLMMIFNDCKQY